MAYKDLEKRKKKEREWREANKEKMRAYQREYMRKWRDNPEQMQKEREKRRAYYAANKELERARAREYMRAYYTANKPLFAERARRKYEERRAWFKEYVATLCCAHCTENHPDCLEFHHPDPKGSRDGRRVEPPITALLTRSKDYILAAAKECIVLCANCHRKEHARLRREQVAR